MAHTFDKFNEPATVLLEINQGSYIKINDKKYSGNKVEIVKNNRRVLVWKGDQIWVCPRVSDRLTINIDNITKRSIARIVGNRSVEDALADTGQKKVKPIIQTQTVTPTTPVRESNISEAPVEKKRGRGRPPKVKAIEEVATQETIVEQAANG